MINEHKFQLNVETKKIIEEIYHHIFLRLHEQYIIVFLCGGASNKKHMSRRDRVRKIWKNDKKSYYKKTLKVFYPEDLLMEVLNKTKDADLLSYERFLANNSHVIVIICESAGALVELGAFTNNKYTVDKVVAAIDKKHAKDKSFIMQGPIKYLKKRNKYNVLEYGQDDEKLSEQLSKNIKEKFKIYQNCNSMIDLTTIVGMHYFIQLIIYFFKELNSQELVDLIRYVSEKEEIKYEDFTVLYNAALKLLFQDKQIVKISGKQYSIYKLTDAGFQTMKNMIKDCAIVGICDKLRVKLLHNEFYKSSHS